MTSAPWLPRGSGLSEAPGLHMVPTRRVRTGSDPKFVTWFGSLRAYEPFRFPADARARRFQTHFGIAARGSQPYPPAVGESLPCGSGGEVAM